MGADGGMTGVAGGDQHQRVAVGRRFGCKIQTYDAARAGTIVHHDGLSLPRAEFLADRAHRDVGAAAGRRRHDHAHCSGRKFFRGHGVMACGVRKYSARAQQHGT